MSHKLTASCAWCGKTRIEGRWVQPSPSEELPVTHGICPPCAKTAFKDHLECNFEYGLA